MQQLDIAKRSLHLRQCYHLPCVIWHIIESYYAFGCVPTRIVDQQEAYVIDGDIYTWQRVGNFYLMLRNGRDTQVTFICPRDVYKVNSQWVAIPLVDATTVWNKLTEESLYIQEGHYLFVYNNNLYSYDKDDNLHVFDFQCGKTKRVSQFNIVNNQCLTMPRGSEFQSIDSIGHKALYCFQDQHYFLSNHLQTNLETKHQTWTLPHPFTDLIVIEHVICMNTDVCAYVMDLTTHTIYEIERLKNPRQDGSTFFCWNDALEVYG